MWIDILDKLMSELIFIDSLLMVLKTFFNSFVALMSLGESRLVIISWIEFSSNLPSSIIIWLGNGIKL